MSDNRAEVLAGAGVVAQDHAGRVLLIRRSDDGHWGIPGGAVNVGETWAEAAARECLEETGWIVQINGLLGVYSDPVTQMHRYPGGTLVQFFGVVFLGSPIRHSEISDDEASDMAWFELDELPGPLLAADVPVLEDASSPAKIPFLR
jgi:8-oxo-dGTP diphosphatase